MPVTPQPDIDTYRSLTDEFRTPAPSIYFLDAGLSAAGGWALAWLAAHTDSLAILGLSFAGSVLLLFRALAFVHEIFHQQAMRGFRYFWHAIVGVPLLLPLLLYVPVHQAHHSARVYGTALDGEYEHLRGRRRRLLAKTFALNLIMPLALVVRFALLTPLSLFVPTVRSQLLPRSVHMAVRFPYTAPESRQKTKREVYVVEVACCTMAWMVILATAVGHERLVAFWAGILVTVGTLNLIRAIATTHLYVEQQDGRDVLGQLEDSMNVDSESLGAILLCPVGLRYHALHHLAPYIPYHNLKRAHQRLMQRLPQGSTYRLVTVSTLAEAWGRVVQATDVDSVGEDATAPINS